MYELYVKIIVTLKEFFYTLYINLIVLKLINFPSIFQNELRHKKK